MMTEIISVENMRNSEKEAVSRGVSEITLMSRAAEILFSEIKDGDSFAVVCGSGNNGGDGFALASLLKERGKEVAVYRIADKTTPTAGVFLEKCVEKGVKILFFDENTDFKGYSVIVDCIFGTGFKGEITGMAEKAVQKINESDAFVVSADINSGLGADNGLSKTCVVSDLTVSFGYFKPGHFLGKAKDVIKRKANGDIGVHSEKVFRLIEKQDIKRLFARKNFSNKGDYGTVTLIGGSLPYSGAIRLSAMANAAMRSGAGVARIAAPESICKEIMPHILESTLFPLSCAGDNIVYDEKEAEFIAKKSTAIAFGMGIGVSCETEKFLRYLLSDFKGTLVIDADGLSILSTFDPSEIGSFKARLILTPHPKEFSRLSGKTVAEILEDPVSAAKEYSVKSGAIILLKGSSTVICDGEKVRISDRGCAGMATAGSGDVLSGIISAICGYTEDAYAAACAAAYIAGAAGEIAEKRTNAVSMVASDTVFAIAEAISEILRD